MLPNNYERVGVPMIGAVLVFVVLFAIRTVFTLINRTIVRNIDRIFDDHNFTIRSSKFSLCINIIMVIGISYYLHFLLTEPDLAIGKIIATICWLILVEISTVFTDALLRVDINGRLIRQKRFFKYHEFFFDDITKITIILVNALEFVRIDVFVGDKKKFAVSVEEIGYKNFIHRLKREHHIQWLTSTGEVFDKETLEC